MAGQHFFLLFALLVSIESTWQKHVKKHREETFRPPFLSDPKPCKGCFEKTPITDEIHRMAKYVVALYSEKPEHLGNAQCKSHYLDEVLEAKKQVVAGTNYILTFRVANGCDETKAICNIELFRSIACHKANDNKCVKLKSNLQCNSTSTTPSEPECGADERYDQCLHHCQGTCEEKHVACPKICVPGCVCDTGYIRADKTGHSYGPCIPEPLCNGWVNQTKPNQCGANEKYDKCSADPNCQDVCGEYPGPCHFMC